MKKPLFERPGCFQSNRISEVRRQHIEEKEPVEDKDEEETQGGFRTRAKERRHEFLFHKVPAQIPVVEVPPIPGKYFRQFPKKEWP